MSLVACLPIKIDMQGHLTCVNRLNSETKMYIVVINVLLFLCLMGPLIWSNMFVFTVTYFTLLYTNPIYMLYIIRNNKKN